MTAQAPETAAPKAPNNPGTLTLAAPDGAEWSFEEVKTDRGTSSLGKENPVLVWKNLDKMRAHYGDEALLNIANGTSLRVSFQNIIRRGHAAGKTYNGIGQLQIDFKPGKRVVGESTPAGRVARQARAAIEASGVSEDSLSKLLEAIKSGKMSEADINALVS